MGFNFIFKAVIIIFIINSVTVGLYQKERRTVIGRLPFKNPPPTPELPHPSLVTLKSSKDPPRRGRVKARIYKNEDEIRTMMDLMPPDSEAVCLTIQGLAFKLKKKKLFLYF